MACSIIFAIGLVTVCFFLLYIIYNLIVHRNNLLRILLLFLTFFLILYLPYVNFAVWIFINFIQFIFVTYLGIHCFVTIINYSKRTRQINNLSSPQNLPTVTILLVVFNEENVIRPTIENLLLQDYDQEFLRIVVVDDNSTDNTPNVLKEYEDMIDVILRKPNVAKGKPAAINEIMPGLNTQLVCVVDCDSLLEKAFVRKAIRHFNNKKVALVQGRNIESNLETAISSLVGLDLDVIHFSVYFPKHYLNGLSMFEGRAALFRRNVFIELGGFDTSLPTEDWDYGCRLQTSGYKLIYDHTIFSNEQAPNTLEAYFKQRFRWLSSTIHSFLKNLPQVVKSHEIGIFKKIDFFFTATYQLWSLTVNMIGFLYFYNSFVAGFPLPFLNFSVFFFLVFVPFLILPAIIGTGKLKYFFYMPFMYLYYWTFTYIISKTCIDFFILGRQVEYEKSEHYPLPATTDK